MQRFINNPDEVVEDTVRGFVKAHADIVRLADNNPRVVAARKAPVDGKVGVITGGGSGHEPAFIGYTGDAMLDAVAVGELFSSPTAKSFLDAAREANAGKGVVCLYGNYAGDNMNVKMAIKLAAKEGIEILTVVANDDVCSATPEEREKRRGVAGEIFMWKCGGAKAAEGASLEEVRATAQKAIDSCRSVGVGLGPCTLPAVGHPNFVIEPGTMEVGIGHHGEPGVRVEPLTTAAEIGRDMARIVLDDHNLPAGSEVAVLISGLGRHAARRALHPQRCDRDRDRRAWAEDPQDLCRQLLHLARDGRCDPLGHGSRRRTEAAPRHRRALPRDALIGGTDMQQFQNASAGDMVIKVADVVIENRAYLSEIDGKIGDGDHGVNMAKGFGMAAERIKDKDMSLSQRARHAGHGAHDRDRRVDGPALWRDVHPVRRGDRQGSLDRRQDLQRHADQRAGWHPVRSARRRSATRRFWMRWYPE